MTDIDYTPEPGSPADRVLELLARNLEEEYTSSDLALKFQIPKAKWEVLLVEPVGKGLIHRAKMRGESNCTWSAGANLEAWAARRSGAAVPLARAATKAARKPWAKRGRPLQLAEIDTSTLKVEIGGGIAKPTGQGGVSKWDALFGLLKHPNTSVAVPLAYKGTLAAYVKKRKKDGRLAGTYIVGIDAADRAKCRVLRTA